MNVTQVEARALDKRAAGASSQAADKLTHLVGLAAIPAFSYCICRSSKTSFLHLYSPISSVFAATTFEKSVESRHKKLVIVAMGELPENFKPPAGWDESTPFPFPKGNKLHWCTYLHSLTQENAPFILQLMSHCLRKHCDLLFATDRATAHTLLALQSKLGIEAFPKADRLFLSTYAQLSDFKEVVYKEQQWDDPIYRRAVRENEQWRDRTRHVAIMPFEENRYQLASGDFINASILRAPFIVTQLPIAAKTIPNKFETTEQFKELLAQSGAKLVVTLSDYKPPFETDVRFVFVDWRHKTSATISQAISSCEEIRGGGPIIVMCENGATLSCSFIACYLAYLAYVRGDERIDLLAIHRELRLPPTGRYGAITTAENYQFIIEFIRGLLKLNHKMIKPCL